MEKMKAVVVSGYGGPEVLDIKTVDKPEPKEDEILIKIAATAITAASTFMREGRPLFGRLFTGLMNPKVKTPGTDLVGTVEAVGSKVEHFNVGDHVLAETGLGCGAYAEYICLNANDLIIGKPNNLTPEEATGILDGACTALAFFTDIVKIEKHQKVLVNGASGSIGTAAVQLAKIFGAEVTAMTSGKNKQLVEAIGADHVLDYTEHDLSYNQIKYDVIFDTVGKLSFYNVKKHLNTKGVFLTPVLKLSTIFTMMFITPFMRKKLKFSATGLRKLNQRKRDLLLVVDMLAQKELTTVIDKVFPFKDVQKAHEYVGTGRKIGNVILKVTE